MATHDAAAEAASLDQDIADLKAQAATLRKTLRIQCSTILSAYSRFPPSSSSFHDAATGSSRRDIESYTAKQHAYRQQCAYRIATPVTAFKIHDPDPNAVDGGRVLGLRFEVMSRGHFLRPFFVMLNRPYPGSKFSRVHRHTVPSAVPLAGLAARFLPRPAPDSEQPPRPSLDSFVRSLRRAIMRYQNRLGVAADLRRRLGLHENSDEDRSINRIVDLSIADAEGKQIGFSWADERSGRLIMDDDGNVQNLIFDKNGRDYRITKKMFGKFDRMEEVAKRLEAFSNQA